MQAAARPTPDAARLPGFADALAHNPLLAHPAAAMAAATAIGFGLANQMAGMFFGAVQGVLEASNRHRENQPGRDVAPMEARPVVEKAAVPGAAGKAAAGRKATAVAEKPRATRSAASTKPSVTESASPTALVKTGAKAEASGSQARAKATKAKGVAGRGDLKRVSGIGPKLETVLKGKGISSLADIAAWSEADMERLDQELGLEGRIKRDDWIGQAKALLK